MQLCMKPPSPRGTFLSRVIREYSLGLVVSSFKGIEESIWEYISSFDVQRYEDGRVSFFKKLSKTNKSSRVTKSLSNSNTLTMLLNDAGG